MKWRRPGLGKTFPLAGRTKSGIPQHSAEEGATEFAFNILR